jgi:integrase
MPVLTERKVETLKPAEPGKRHQVMDALVPGFGVRVTDRGERSFILYTRYPGRPGPARRRLGRVGELTLAEAREKARRWLALIARGIDPDAEEERARREEDQRRENTFAAVADDFIRLVVIGPDSADPKQRKGEERKRDIEREFVSRWGKRPITDITRRDVTAVIDAAVNRGAPYQAHNLLGHVRRLFNWAIARDCYGLERSPCDRMKPKEVIGKKALRKRVLDDAELRAFWRATETADYPYGPLFRMLALTGQRKSEVAEARWREFDIEKRLWVIPAERMKMDAAHVVPLVDEVVAILEQLPRFKKGDYVFTTVFGAKPVNGFSKAKALLDKRMHAELQQGADDLDEVELEPFVIHDIRRTMRTGLSALPVPDMVRELVIAHARPGLHQVYDQYSYVEEKRRALELWAARLRSIVEPPIGAKNVVELRASVVEGVR